MNCNHSAASTRLLAAVLLSVFTWSATAQQNKTSDMSPTGTGVFVYAAFDMASRTPTVRPSDVSSPEALVAALHDSVSGPAGPVDWNRYRSLFVPTARTYNLRTGADDVKHIETLTIDEEIRDVGPKREKVAWYEIILVRHIQRFNNIALTIDSSDARTSAEGKAIERAVTTCEMLYDGKRWWIASAISDIFPTSRPLPPELDPAKQKP
jgi:hypothetical protein